MELQIAFTLCFVIFLILMGICYFCLIDCFLKKNLLISNIGNNVTDTHVPIGAHAPLWSPLPEPSDIQPLLLKVGSVAQHPSAGFWGWPEGTEGKSLNAVFLHSFF